MFTAQMSINLHRQSTAIFVAKPAAYRRNIHPGFNTGGREEVPESIVRELQIA